ncbi:hypothetical protein C8Q77DRAFT_281971 [Trametes polyzona]|nr:hypothetical protein C8Q77DRAFT_281971 [Trametes polyzona]
MPSGCCPGTRRWAPGVPEGVVLDGVDMVAYARGSARSLYAMYSREGETTSREEVKGRGVGEDDRTAMAFYIRQRLSLRGRLGYGPERTGARRSTFPANPRVGAAHRLPPLGRRDCCCPHRLPHRQTRPWPVARAVQRPSCSHPSLPAFLRDGLAMAASPRIQRRSEDPSCSPQRWMIARYSTNAISSARCLRSARAICMCIHLQPRCVL